MMNLKKGQGWCRPAIHKLKYTNTQAQIHKNTNTQIQKYTNKKTTCDEIEERTGLVKTCHTQTQIHKYTNTNTQTQIHIHKYTNKQTTCDEIDKKTGLVKTCQYRFAVRCKIYEVWSNGLAVCSKLFNFSNNLLLCFVIYTNFCYIQTSNTCSFPTDFCPSKGLGW